jgi:hypothetical protein
LKTNGRPAPVHLPRLNRWRTTGKGNNGPEPFCRHRAAPGKKTRPAFGTKLLSDAEEALVAGFISKASKRESAPALSSTMAVTFDRT